MAQPWKVQKGAATQAQEGKAWKQNLFNSGGLKISPIDLETGSDEPPAEETESESDDVECTGWTGVQL